MTIYNLQSDYAKSSRLNELIFEFIYYHDSSDNTYQWFPPSRNLDLHLSDRQYIYYNLDTNFTDTHIFIAEQKVKLIGVKYILSTRGSTSCACTIKKTTGSQAPSDGGNMHAILDFTSTTGPTANTVISLEEVDLFNNELVSGDRISLLQGGTNGSLQGQMTFIIAPNSQA